MIKFYNNALAAMNKYKNVHVVILMIAKVIGNAINVKIIIFLMIIHIHAKKTLKNNVTQIVNIVI